MNRYVVDASVVVKWYVAEVLSDEAARFLAAGHYLIAPDLLGSEVGNVLWKKVRRGEITYDEGFHALRAFGTATVSIVDSAPLRIPAYEAAVLLGRTVHDCLYLVLADERKCPLVTADRRFYNALRGSPYASQVKWLEDVA